MKKLIIRFSLLLVLSLYMVLIFPSQLNILLDYLELKDAKKSISGEIVSMANSLNKVEDVYKIFTNFNLEILSCSVTEFDNSSVPKIVHYSGEDIGRNDNRIIEFILEDTDKTNYIFACIGSYNFTYDSIVITTDGEIVIRIFCK